MFKQATTNTSAGNNLIAQKSSLDTFIGWLVTYINPPKDRTLLGFTIADSLTRTDNEQWTSIIISLKDIFINAFPHFYQSVFPLFRNSFAFPHLNLINLLLDDNLSREGLSTEDKQEKIARFCHYLLNTHNYLTNIEELTNYCLNTIGNLLTIKGLQQVYEHYLLISEEAHLSEIIKFYIGEINDYEQGKHLLRSSAS